MDKTPLFKKRAPGFATKAIHSGQRADQWKSRSIQPPIFTTTVFEQTEVDESDEYFYSRLGNPTRNVLEKCLADIDDAKFCVTFSSGMGAIMAAMTQLESGDHVICSFDVYGGTTQILKKHIAQYGIELDMAELIDASELKPLIKKNTKMVLLETPSNPLNKIVDIGKLSEIIKGYKDQQIIMVVDNTFLTPYFQQPLELGADIAIYSMTKYLNGHSDVTMGAATTNCPKLLEKLQYGQKALGIIPSPFDCYQVTRSFKTLALRMDKHSENGIAVAKFLEGHPFVERVFHPGLPSHPQHEVALKQSYGHSGILAFYVKGTAKHAEELIKSFKLILNAGSLGGAETMMCIPILTSHTSLPPEVRLKLGLTDNLVRLSVGLEDVDSIIADLDQALKKVFNK